MIRLNNCIPGPVYPLSNERTVSQSCIGADHRDGSAQRGQYQFGPLAPKSCAHSLGKMSDWVKLCGVCYRCSFCFSSPFQVVRKMMWLMDHVFKYTNFGLVSLIHGDFFIRQVRDPRFPLKVLVGSLFCSLICLFFVITAFIYFFIISWTLTCFATDTRSAHICNRIPGSCAAVFWVVFLLVY